MLTLKVSDPKVRSVRDFAKSLSRRDKPRLLDRVPHEASEAGKCYANSISYVIAHGGDVIPGWELRTSPDVFHEAVQHAVVRERNGKFIDVTPHPRGEQRTCFVPDASLNFSPAGGATEINRYRIICVPHLVEKVRKLISLVSRQQEYMLTTGLLAFGSNMGERVEGLDELVKDIAQEVGHI